MLPLFQAQYLSLTPQWLQPCVSRAKLAFESRTEVWYVVEISGGHSLFMVRHSMTAGQWHIQPYKLQSIGLLLVNAIWYTIENWARRYHILVEAKVNVHLEDSNTLFLVLISIIFLTYQMTFNNETLCFGVIITISKSITKFGEMFPRYIILCEWRFSSNYATQSIIFRRNWFHTWMYSNTQCT